MSIILGSDGIIAALACSGDDLGEGRSWSRDIFVVWCFISVCFFPEAFNDLFNYFVGAVEAQLVDSGFGVPESLMGLTKVANEM